MVRVLLAAALVGIAATAAAQFLIGGVQIPETLRVDGETLRLSSCGVRDTLWIDHYVAALYLSPDESPLVVQDPGKRKAILVRVISTRFLPDDIPKQWRGPLAQGLERKSMSRLSRAYANLVAGDVMIFTYDPETGVTVRVNGRIVARAPDHEAVDAVLAAWAEADPISGKLQRLVLENPCPRGN